jgi:hypothetical protein
MRRMNLLCTIPTISIVDRGKIGVLSRMKIMETRRKRK